MKGNILGDIRAENDTSMLEATFWQTTDYKALLESYDRPIVVGRRGTGKSALVHMLSKHWEKKAKTRVLLITPVEEQIIGLRDVLKLFGDNYLHIKAGSKLAWRYALYMEVIIDLTNHYKLKSNIDIKSIEKHLISWGSKRQNITSKIRKKLLTIIENEKGTRSPESRIADLSDEFELDLLEEVILEALNDSGYQIVIFADKLDEGYTPDNMGVAIVDGFVQSIIDIKHSLDDKVVAFAFIRDNIYRAISKNDPDFTRNIEGQTLRLHWDEYNLFNLVCNRLRAAFSSSIENNTRMWNAHTADGLRAREGFRLALKLTLYRPRDILVLLNDAFLRAGTQNRDTIIYDDIDCTAKQISNNRLNDLLKEYEIVFPALDIFISCFMNIKPEISVSEAMTLIEQQLDNINSISKFTLQDILLTDGPKQVIQRLYSIGFIGVYNSSSSSFVFCHDGKEPDRDFLASTKILLHPCYWLALGITNQEINLEQAEDIHDEYDIEVSAVDSEFRSKKIGALMVELNNIPEGINGATDFESWTKKALMILFATDLENLVLHPNKNGLQQRDIVATNLGSTLLWKRILDDYNSRQIIFEVKNYRDLTSSDYRQINSYLSKEYGRMAFIICRDINNNLSKHKELNWVRELYNDHNKLIIKISSKFLEKQLSKMRSPQKHDELSKEINKLLDQYIRMWLPNKCKI
ncbi:P-loop ATPase, Sll1717 family [Shewanella baltica]|uniref:P-loop ATPase, Sll1717 family n=1 Tax=Shewanella baltica TaxID=62322 RepID=UPI00217D7021|nr:ATP-binding protein [Shewanella baltica]MCS6094595.1 ATP-binding protein [Shewanella baltica]MCS6226069.1 ATP-binding protein [Shewanella baltica]